MLPAAGAEEGGQVSSPIEDTYRQRLKRAEWQRQRNLKRGKHRDVERRKQEGETGRQTDSRGNQTRSVLFPAGEIVSEPRRHPAPSSALSPSLSAGPPVSPLVSLFERRPEVCCLLKVEGEWGSQNPSPRRNSSPKCPKTRFSCDNCTTPSCDPIRIFRKALNRLNSRSS